MAMNPNARRLRARYKGEEEPPASGRRGGDDEDGDAYVELARELREALEAKDDAGAAQALEEFVHLCKGSDEDAGGDRRRGRGKPTPTVAIAIPD